MRHPGSARRGMLLTIGLLPALVVGAYLLLRDVRAAMPPPTPAPTHAAAAPFATTTPAPVPAATLVAGFAASPETNTATAPAPTGTPTPTPTPTATPAPAWLEVGRWSDRQVIYTDTFTVRGPWRIRWRLSAPTETFQLMIEEGNATPILHTAAAGATEGVFEETRGGTFSLMLHNTIPYEVIVEEFRAPP